MKSKKNFYSMITKIALFLFVFSGIVTSYNASAQTIIAQGECGTDLFWVLTSDSTLTISGSGNMNNYFGDDAPWHSYKNRIKTVIIGDEVNTIGSYAFYTISNIKSVTIGSSVTRIGQIAFSYCSGLTTVFIPNSVVTIEMAAFQNCTSLTTVTVGSAVTSMSTSVFANCSSLNSMIIHPTTPPPLYEPSHIAFTGIPEDIPVFVPCNSVDAYQNHSVWSYFTNYSGVSEITSLSDTICQGQNFYTGFGFEIDQGAGLYYRVGEGVDCDTIIYLELIEKIIPIPTNFDVVQFDSTISVTWEGDAAHYELYRNGQFLIATDVSYYIDEDLISGREYCYQVKAIVDENCKSALTDKVCVFYSIVGVEDHKMPLFNIFPNPAREKIFINSEYVGEVKIYDMLGKMMLCQNISNKTEIDISRLSQGTYILTVFVNDKIIGSRMVIKQP